MTKGIAFILNIIIIYILIGSINPNLATSKDSKFSITLENYKNIKYIAEIYVGSNSQAMKTIFSTATGLTLFKGNNCTECREITNEFDSSTSIAFKNLSGENTLNVKITHFKL